MTIGDFAGKFEIDLVGDVNWGMHGHFDNRVDRWKQLAEKAEGESKGPPDIVLIISTRGGDAMVARCLCERIRLMQVAGVSIFTLGLGAVYSGGFALLTAVPLEKRFLTQNTDVMLHCSRNLAESTLPVVGTVSSREQMLAILRESVEDQKRTDRWQAQHIAAALGWTERKAMGMLRSGQFFSAAEAVAAGIVSGILVESMELSQG